MNPEAGGNGQAVTEGDATSAERPLMKKWWMRTLLIIDAVVAALLLCEIIIRLTYGGLVVTASLVKRDPDIGVRLIAGARGRATCSSYRIAYEISSQGLRDRIYSERKPSSAFRVLVIGDSFVFGHGVEQEEIFTEVAERKFAAAGTNIEIVNAGVFGYGTDNEFLWLKEVKEKFDPDIIFVLVCTNDPGNNMSNGFFSLDQSSTNKELQDIRVRFQAERLHSFAAEGTPADKIPFYRSVLVRFHLTHFLAEKFGLRPGWSESEFTQIVNPDAFEPVSLSRENLSNATLLTIGIINEMKQWSNVPVLLGLVRSREGHCKKDPVFEELRWGLQRLQKEPLLLFEFREETHTDHVFISGDVHWNAKGHAEADEIFAEWVKQFLPGRESTK